MEQTTTTNDRNTNTAHDLMHAGANINGGSMSSMGSEMGKFMENLG